MPKNDLVVVAVDLKKKDGSCLWVYCYTAVSEHGTKILVSSPVEKWRKLLNSSVDYKRGKWFHLVLRLWSSNGWNVLWCLSCLIIPCSLAYPCVTKMLTALFSNFIQFSPSPFVFYPLCAPSISSPSYPLCCVSAPSLPSLLPLLWHAAGDSCTVDTWSTHTHTCIYVAADKDTSQQERGDRSRQ